MIPEKGLTNSDCKSRTNKMFKVNLCTLLSLCYLSLSLIQAVVQRIDHGHPLVAHTIPFSVTQPSVLANETQAPFSASVTE